MTARPWSLAARLGWRLGAVMLLAVALAAAAVAWRAVKTVHDLDDLALESQVRMIVANLPSTLDGDGAVTLPDDLVGRFRSSDGDNLFLVYHQGRLVATSDVALAAMVTPLLRHAPHAGFLHVSGLAGHERGMVGLLTELGPWRVIVLQGREQTTALVGSLMVSFGLAAVWMLLPIGGTMILVGVLTLRQGLRPVREVSTAAALVGPSHPGARLPVASLPREIAPLVQAANEALTRMEQALVTQRHFMADAAHALRTPLAVLTARLDMLDEQPDVAALRHDADRVTRMVGQLLRMGRLEGLPLDVTQPVDLRAVAVEAISGLVPLGLQRQIEIALGECASPVLVRGNHAALVLALTNLIENALAHTPAGSAVEIAITPPAIISVLDRGPGVPVESRERVFKRFERGPASSKGGAGLGLAIVTEIAAAHGATVRVTSRDGGGAAFVLSLSASSVIAEAGPIRRAVRV